MTPAPKRVLVVGSGGREHALAWKLAAEEGVERVAVAPGNPGMRDVAEVFPGTAATDVAGLTDLAERLGADLVVIGPEAPLVDGVADALRQRRLDVFGPSRSAARLEGSKAYCREVAEAAGVPMAEGAAYDDPAAAIRAARALGGRVVVKADGLAAGKGVTVCETVQDSEAAIRAAMIDGAFGAAGRRVVVERALDGREASVICICDGTHALALPAARDHKRIRDGDEGPNTGGMGAYSPLDDLNEAGVAAIVATVHRPVLAEMSRRGSPFRGALYAGLMLTAAGTRLLEFNVRFGDPETQALLPRVDAPLGVLLAAAARDQLVAAATELGIVGTLLPTRPGRGASVAVVLAAAGYPGTPEVGASIEGVDEARGPDTRIFWGGVRAAANGMDLLTAGGRVATVVGEGLTLEDAAAHAYAAADLVQFTGRHFRRDIGRVPVTAGAGAGAVGATP